MKIVVRTRQNFLLTICVVSVIGCSPSNQESQPESTTPAPDGSETRTADVPRPSRPAIEEINNRWRERLEVTQDSRIIGGEPVPPGEQPWAVAILYENSAKQWKQYCGGTLIAAEWVLTAAHCEVENIDRLVIGNTDLSSPPTSDIYEIEVVYNHSAYKVASRHDSDIALIKLKGLTDVPAAPLLQYDDPTSTGEEATVVGWGHTAEGGNASDILRKVDVEFTQQLVCTSNYQQRGDTITDNMLCAGADGKDSCQGDSGGGLLVYDTDDGENFSYRVAGVVSFGFGCARPDYPGVYTKITNFREWIDSTMSQT